MKFFFKLVGLLVAWRVRFYRPKRRSPLNLYPHDPPLPYSKRRRKPPHLDMQSATPDLAAALCLQTQAASTGKLPLWERKGF
jgi:hypothetical protein